MSNQTRRSDTRPVDDGLGHYLEGIGSVELLTAEDEVRLAQLIEAGQEAAQRLDEGSVDDPDELRSLERSVRLGRDARQQFIEANLRLVISNARRYAGGDVDMLDLVQEGNLGLIRAIEKFDWRKGFKFSTYATWWIRQAMQRARTTLTETIRVPTGVSDIVPTVRTATDRLRATLGRAPEVAEVAAATGIPIAEVERAQNVKSTVSLEAPVGEEGALLSDFIADDEAVDPESETEARVLEESVRRSLASLPERQRRLVEMRFGLDGDPPATMALISSEMDIPEHRIRAALNEALAALRNELQTVEEMRVA